MKKRSEKKFIKEEIERLKQENIKLTNEINAIKLAMNQRSQSLDILRGYIGMVERGCK